MIEELKELYVDSGIWANPILVVSGVLFLVGSVMLFTVRLIKRFILFTVLSLLLPSGIGVVGYLEEIDSVHEAVLERGEELTEEMIESAEELSFSPLYLGVLGSIATAALGVAGIVRARRSTPPSNKEHSS